MNMPDSRALITKTVSVLSLLFLLLFGFIQSGYAAFCSLRDPISAINLLYPAADQHRSIVRSINQQAREQIAERLPFTLHFNEIGQHTLYLAVKDKTPLGFIHARSELADWGMIELAWSIGLDLSVNGFYFQRCRSPACDTELTNQLSSDLQGLAFNQLRSLISDDGEQLNVPLARKYQDNKDLVLAIIRSALKTVAITEIAWSEDITDIRRQELVMRHFGNSNDLHLQPAFDSNTELQRQADLSGINNASIYLEATEVLVVLENGKELGRLVDARWQDGNRGDQFSWLFSSAGEVLAIQSSKEWPDQEIKSSFEEVIGTSFLGIENCSTAAEVVGKSLFTTGFSIAQ